MATKRSKKSFFSKMFKGFTMKKRSTGRKSRRSRGRKTRRSGKRGGSSLCAEEGFFSRKGIIHW